MKKIFRITYFVLICLLAMLCSSCQKEAEPYVLSVGDSELMVQSKDLGAGDWNTARTMCTNSTVAGFTDWRLPTDEELMLLYNNRKSIGGFLMRPYWSSLTSSSDHGYIDFKNGNSSITEYADRERLCMVRAVRTIAPTTPEEPEVPADPEKPYYVAIPVANLMVQTTDLGFGNWATANAMCMGSTVADYTDWRLPTKEELMILYTNRNSIGDFGYTRYWSSSQEENSTCWIIHFSNGELGTYDCSSSCGVRAVRYIKPPTPEVPEEPYVTISELKLMVQKKDLGVVPFSSAEGLCAGSIVGGFTDWRLPDINELQAMYVNRDIIGNFRYKNESGGAYEGYYWSSTVYDSTRDRHYLISFLSGEIRTLGDYEDIFRYSCSVRAVRTIIE